MLPDQPILRHVEVIRDAVPGWKTHPFDIPATAKLGRLDLAAPVMIFVGDNGSGKSTLVEAIAIKAGFNAQGGTKNFTSKLRPSESDRHRCLRLPCHPSASSC